MSPEIVIEQGRLKGKTVQNLDGNNYFSFQGIPYAQPPTGSHRFKDPIAPEKWTGIFDATKEGDACYSFKSHISEKIHGSEDCLVLNVFTKELVAKRPVMVFIHGGAFTVGSSRTVEYSPDFLLTEDVVLVTFNYRLGIFGFLALEEPSLEIHGNAGFKDMVMVLKWVQKNIVQFGGDANNITIFGGSSGGCSVHALILSPLAKGLFHKAIAQSGTALTPWSKGHNYSAEILNILDANYNDEELLAALLGKTLPELLDIQRKISNNGIACEKKPFGLIVDRASKNPFLPDEPINLILSGNYTHVPLMIGYVTAEGLCFEFLKSSVCSKMGIASNIPWELGYEYESQESRTISNLIKHFYRDVEPDASDVTTSIMVKTDTMFMYPIYVTAKKHAETSKFPVYMYQVSIETKLNYFKKMLNTNEPGVCHTDEIGYLFKCDSTPDLEKNSLEVLSIRRFVKLWTNFAKFGNPTPNENDEILGNIQWKSVQGESFPVLDIGKKLQLLENPQAERVSFWNGLYKRSPAKSKVVLC